MKIRIETSAKALLLAFCHPELVEGSARSVAAVYDRRCSRSNGSRRAPRDGPAQGLRRLPLQTLALFLGFCLTSSIPCQAQTGPDDSVGPMAKVTLHIGKASLTTEIAASSAQEERGLMYVAKLPDNDGMIFLLPQVTTATFWMKNTLIPLSVAFIDKNGVILEIHDMKAMDETITRSDSDQVAYALETNLHWFALNGIKPGDKIQPAPSTLGSPLP